MLPELPAFQSENRFRFLRQIGGSGAIAEENVRGIYPITGPAVSLTVGLAGMRILLQNTKTGLYFQNPNSWVDRIEVASDFRTSQKALEHLQLKCLTGVQVIAVFIGGSYVESVAYQLNDGSHPRIRA